MPDISTRQIHSFITVASINHLRADHVCKPVFCLFATGNHPALVLYHDIQLIIGVRLRFSIPVKRLALASRHMVLHMVLTRGEGRRCRGIQGAAKRCGTGATTRPRCSPGRFATKVCSYDHRHSGHRVVPHKPQLGDGRAEVRGTRSNVDGRSHPDGRSRSKPSPTPPSGTGPSKTRLWAMCHHSPPKTEFSVACYGTQARYKDHQQFARKKQSATSCQDSETSRDQPQAPTVRAENGLANPCRKDKGIKIKEFYNKFNFNFLLL